jgi:hypothetical protein
MNSRTAEASILLSPGPGPGATGPRLVEAEEGDGDQLGQQGHGLPDPQRVVVDVAGGQGPIAPPACSAACARPPRHCSSRPLSRWRAG